MENRHFVKENHNYVGIEHADNMLLHDTVVYKHFPPWYNLEMVNHYSLIV